MAMHRMTPARRAALKKAQAASARKRRKGGSKSKAKMKKKGKGKSKIWGWSPRAVATRMAIGGAVGAAYGSYIDRQRRR